MKKKNSKYPDPTNCIIKENIIYEHFREEFTNIFEKFNDYNRTYTTKTTDNGIIEKLTKKDNDFFKQYYVPARLLRTIDAKREETFSDIENDEIGLLEWQFIIFCTGFGGAFKNQKIIFLTGNVGEGKSSLINYVLKYLYFSKRTLKNRILPLVINCQGFKPDIEKEYRKTGAIDNFFDKKLKDAINGISYNFAAINNEEFWTWYEGKFSTEYTKYVPDLRLLDFGKEELYKKIKQERLKEKQSEPEFVFYSSYYIIEKLKKDIIVVFDNIDPFDIEIIKKFYWKAKSIINKSEIKVIISLRKDTYRKLQDKLAEINIVKTIPIYNDLKRIILKRCENIDKNIAESETTKPLEFSSYEGAKVKIDINPSKAVKRIISLILNPIGLNCILNFSRKDVRKSLELLRITFSSGFLPISEVGTYLMQDNDYNDNYSLPPEYIISTLTTFGYGTYFTQEAKKLNIPGLLNIFSCANHQTSIQIFSKLFILNYFSKIGFEISVDNKKKIINHYKECVDSMELSEELVSGFVSSFQRLFNKGLISSPDAHFTDTDEEFINDIKEVKISTLGEYYINNLMFSPFYLMFIKDDVYLHNNEDFDDAFYVYNEENINRFFWTNIKNIISFLKLYGELEIDSMLQFKKHETLDKFIHRFGCIEEKLFTLKIISELETFISNKKPTSNELVYFLNEKQIMNSSDVRELSIIKDHLINEYNNKIA